MRILRIYVTEWNKEEQIQRYIREKKNSKIEFGQDSTKFYSNFNSNPENVRFETAVIEFNWFLVDSFVKHAVESSKKVRYLNQEDNDKMTGVEKNSGSVAGAIHSIIMKWHYNQENWDIFDFVTDLFVRILMGHFFHNGNKRVSIVFLSTVLWNLGYYLKWTSDEKYIYERTYENDLKGFIQELESKENADKNWKIVIGKIKTWIYRNIVIALNFRVPSYIIA
ncbi:MULTISPECIES: type II toxin-antitoxin system death-on-curing family toxin [unclassified Mycoplasma]|uniref:type II toxin-antitoxin system death-on-curing family toxin n=1 Tax=unclassified Mycoplasma TaxID=2683645 RepID=UPI000FDEE9C7